MKLCDEKANESVNRKSNEEANEIESHVESIVWSTVWRVLCVRLTRIFVMSLHRANHMNVF